MVVKALVSPPTASISRGDLQRGALVGALEEQVLQEVRGAGLRAGLVPRADRDPDAERDAAHRRDRLGEHAQPAGQHGPPHRAAQRVVTDRAGHRPGRGSGAAGLRPGGVPDDVGRRHRPSIRGKRRTLGPAHANLLSVRRGVEGTPPVTTTSSPGRSLLSCAGYADADARRRRHPRRHPRPLARRRPGHDRPGRRHGRPGHADRGRRPGRPAGRRRRPRRPHRRPAPRRPPGGPCPGRSCRGRRCPRSRPRPCRRR